mgnify:CR=1 FL=1
MTASVRPGGTPLTARLRAGLGTLLIVISFLLVTPIASAWHAWNMHGATIVCESGSPDRGAWAEPDMCTIGAGEDHPAEHEPLKLFDPWTSALVAAVIMGGFGALSVGGIAALNEVTLRRAAVRLVISSTLLVGAGALLFWSG